MEEKSETLYGVGDAVAFWKEIKKYRETKNVIEEHHSSQLIQMAAPVGMIIPGSQQQAQAMPVVIQTCWIVYTDKPEKKKK